MEDDVTNYNDEKVMEVMDKVTLGVGKILKSPTLGNLKSIFLPMCYWYTNISMLTFVKLTMIIEKETK